MAVTAIQTKLFNVDFVRKRNRLRGLISDNLGLWCCVVTYRKNHSNTNGAKAKCDFERK